MIKINLKAIMDSLETATPSNWWARVRPYKVQALIEDNERMAKALEWEEHRCGRLHGPLGEALAAHRERFEK